MAWRSQRTGDAGPQTRPLVQVENLSKAFQRQGEEIRAVDGVSFQIAPGTSLGLVGESGSGKTTIGRCVLRLIDPTGGRIRFAGEDITDLSGGRLRALRPRMQMVFQDPYDSLNPRLRVRQTVEEPLKLTQHLSRRTRRARLAELLDLVKLDEAFVERYPHELSGGQRQRVGIARALATQPDLLVLDEPTSALDWLIRYDILDLLNSLREDLGLTYLFISHDLSAVSAVCENVAVLYLGTVVEFAPTERLFRSPQHPYTRALLSAVLKPGLDGPQERIRLQTRPRASASAHVGCPLYPRCPIALPTCSEVQQELLPIAESHLVACMRLTQEPSIDWPTEGTVTQTERPQK